MQASTPPLKPLSSRTKWLIALCLCMAVLLLEFLTYHMAYRIGYDEGALHTPPVVIQKSDEKAFQKLSRFMADVFASRESLSGILDNREERLAWIRDPEVRSETAWGLTRELISRGGVKQALPSARELIEAGYAEGKRQIWAPRADAVARALLAEHQYAAAYDYLKIAVDGYEKGSMAAELVKALQTMSSIDQILNRNDQANALLQRAVEASALLGSDSLAVKSRLLPPRAGWPALRAMFRNHGPISRKLWFCSPRNRARPRETWRWPASAWEKPCWKQAGRRRPASCS